MKALSSTHGGRKYLRIARSSDIGVEETSVEEIRASRDKILPLFDDAGIERVLFDYRKFSFERFSSSEIDTLAKEFKVDFPFCKWIALLCPSHTLSDYQQLQRSFGRYSIELQLHSELESAKSWLCTH